MAEECRRHRWHLVCDMVRLTGFGVIVDSVVTHLCEQGAGESVPWVRIPVLQSPTGASERAVLQA